MASGGTMGGLFAGGGWSSPTTNYGTLDSRGDLPVIDFSGATEETIYFPFYLKGYAGGGLTVKVKWSGEDGAVNTDGDVVWGGSIERGNTDIDATSFATEQLSAAVTTSATSGIPVESTITFTDGAVMDSMADGEFGRFRLARKVANAGDTMSGFDAAVWSVLIYET
jgi:hypothetical protein